MGYEGFNSSEVQESYFGCGINTMTAIAHLMSQREQGPTSTGDEFLFSPVGLMESLAAKSSVKIAAMAGQSELSSIGARQMMVAARTPEHVALRSETAAILRQARTSEMSPVLLRSLVSAPPSTGGPVFRTWNQFQAGTPGQFASRADAAAGWSVYKDANGIVTGTVRSQAARSQFLRSLADDWRTPSWQKQWLQEGRVPPGYEVDHIKPLSIDGPDTPANMRLQGIDLHRLWHKVYRPWDW
jgi:hypothetical protein